MAWYFLPPTAPKSSIDSNFVFIFTQKHNQQIGIKWIEKRKEMKKK